MTKKSDAPAIRFKGFSDAWEQRKWINTVDISTNMVDPKSGKYDLLPHVAPGNIESFTGRLYDNVKLVGEENLISGKFVFNVGDIVYGKINPQLGKYVFARFSGLTSADAYVLNAKNGIVQKFLYAVIQTRDFYDYSVSVSKRSGMPKINRDELNAYSYWAPSESEQLKIGEYLLTLDHLITLHQRQPFLHSPPDISLIVQLTPPFYTFSWEQRKLGELVDRVVRKNTNNESTLPLTISAQYGLVDQITYFNNRVASRDVSNYYLVLNGEFAYNKSTSDGYPFGAVKRLDLYEKGVLSTLYIVFAPKKEQQIDSDYLTVFFDTDRWHKGVAERAAEGARNHGLLNISAEDFFDIDLSVPKDIVEQKQIGAFIRQLDNLITLHQRQTIVYAVIRSIRKVILAERQYFAPPMVRKSP